MSCDLEVTKKFPAILQLAMEADDMKLKIKGLQSINSWIFVTRLVMELELSFVDLLKNLMKLNNLT